MPNEHNLTPWKPGQSGNPAGYSRGRREVDKLLDVIDERNADRQVQIIWLKRILEGDFRYFKEYIDRKDGKIDSPEQPPSGINVNIRNGSKGSGSGPAGKRLPSSGGD